MEMYMGILRTLSNTDAKYSRMDEVKFVEDNFKKICKGMVWSRSYPKIF